MNADKNNLPYPRSSAFIGPFRVCRRRDLERPRPHRPGAIHLSGQRRLARDFLAKLAAPGAAHVSFSTGGSLEAAHPPRRGPLCLQRAGVPVGTRSAAIGPQSRAPANPRQDPQPPHRLRNPLPPVAGEMLRASESGRGRNPGLLPIRGKIRNLRTGYETLFRLWLENSSDSIVPVRFEVQPRSFLRLTFEALPA